MDTNLQYATTYNTVTGVVPFRKNEQKRVNAADLPATKTSINLGRGNTNTYYTMNQRNYSNIRNRGPVSTVNKDFI